MILSIPQYMLHVSQSGFIAYAKINMSQITYVIYYIYVYQYNCIRLGKKLPQHLTLQYLKANLIWLVMILTEQ